MMSRLTTTRVDSTVLPLQNAGRGNGKPPTRSTCCAAGGRFADQQLPSDADFYRDLLFDAICATNQLAHAAAGEQRARLYRAKDALLSHAIETEPEVLRLDWQLLPNGRWMLLVTWDDGFRSASWHACFDQLSVSARVQAINACGPMPKEFHHAN